MGLGGSKISLTANADSPFESGRKVIISGALDEMGLTEDKFWELFAKVKREPLAMPPDSGLTVVKHEMTDLENGGFRVVDTISGLPWGEAMVTLTHSFDKEQRLWVTVSDRDPSFNKVPVSVYSRLILEPLRLESWCTNGAARIHGPVLGQSCDYIVNEIAKEAGVDSVLTCKPDSDSPGGGGKKSCLVPIGDKLTVEQFWENFDKVHRKAAPLPYLTSHEVQDLPDGAFHAIETFGYGAKVIHILHTLNPEKDEWVATYYNEWPESGPQDKDRVSAFHTKVHKNPLLVEVWQDIYESSTADEGFKIMIQYACDKLIEFAAKEEGASSGGGWFS